MSTAIDNNENILDSRDIQERIEELAKEEGFENFDEFKALKNLKEQYVDHFGEDSWEFGAQFIHESYFQDYAEELARDSGAIDNTNQWPLYCIDWEQAARDLSWDYTTIDFDGVDYYTREA